MRIIYRPAKSLKPELPTRAAPPSEPEIITPRELAHGAAIVLVMMSTLPFAFALWRVGADMGFARAFFIEDGALSHWQVWFAVAVLLLLTASQLKRTGRPDDDEPATS